MQAYSEYPQSGAYKNIGIVWEGYGGHIEKTAPGEYSAFYNYIYLGSESTLGLARALIIEVAGG